MAVRLSISRPKRDYTVDDSSLPSLFSGGFGDSLKETFNRVKYGGVAPSAQKVFFINLQEIKGIKFGTQNALNYFDNFYNAELFLRAHGTYSIKITDPLLFFAEAIPKNQARVNIEDINEQYLSEFLEALQTSMNQMSIDGIRVSHVVARSSELSKYMTNVLDADWKRMRGFEVQAVGIASISYDDESKELINMRNKGAMLGDPSVREGYVQGSIARGLEAAGSNQAGSAATFMGLGIGMQAGGGFMGTASQANVQQMQQQQMPQSQQSQQAQPAQPAVQPVAVTQQPQQGQQGQPPQNQAGNGPWTCSCGVANSGKFCPNCGSKRPERVKCANCGHEIDGAKPKFCPECGTPFA
jgi:membrane protease subunit (stomatin/prohibitin family)